MDESKRHELLREFVEELKRSVTDIRELLPQCDGGTSQPFFAIYKHFHTLKGMAQFLSLPAIHETLEQAEQIFKTLYYRPSLWRSEWTYDFQKYLDHLIDAVEQTVLFSDGQTTPVPFPKGIEEALKTAARASTDHENADRLSPRRIPVKPVSETFVRMPTSRVLQLLHQWQRDPKADISPDMVKEAIVELRNLNKQLLFLDSQCRELNRRLIKSERRYTQDLNQLQLESKGKNLYLAHVAHEIRTLLNAILGFGSLLTAGGLTSEQRVHLTHLNNSARMILEFLERIMDFARLEEGRVHLRKEECDLEEMIGPLFQILRTRAVGKPVYLLYEIDETVPRTIRVDALRLRQIIMNLLDNALKFTKSGWVKLSVAGKRGAPNEGVTTLRFVIEDTGMGIPADKLQEIFRRFEQVSDDVARRFGGSGLGLYLVKTFIDKMNGKITIQSELHKGTRFIVDLPVENVGPPHAVRSEDERHRGQAARFSGLHILLVTPSQQLVRHIENRLRAWGLPAGHIDVACDSMAALKRLYDSGAVKPSVILIDALLPDDRAHKLFVRIRQDSDYSHIPICLLSSDLRAEQEERYRCLPDPKGVLFLPLMVEEWTSMFREDGGERGQPPKAAASKREEPVSLSGVRILIVEDSEPNRDLLQYYFHQLDCRVEFAADGAEALQKIQHHSYDLCFMDIQMPTMDGLTATRKIRTELKSRIPIIALTAASKEEERRNCFEAGMDDYLSKPFEMDALKALIKKHLGI